MGQQRTENELRAAWQEVAGYLNFATGTPDPKFLKSLNAIFTGLEINRAAAEPAWKMFFRLLRIELADLQQHNPTFKDISQATAVTDLTADHLLPAYRSHHRDLLHHQADALLFNSLFVGRAFEAVFRQSGPWTETKRIVTDARLWLNDFMGHRPVAVLETEQKIEPYPHEKVRPIPLYVAGAGTAPGRYHTLIETTLAILAKSNGAILDAASFDLELLEELAVDPRAYDFNHPVNKRPNYHFGQWDPHHIDHKGRYRRFVLVQVTLDAILERVEKNKVIPREELMYEAAAVLAGTILMATGTSGSGPETHDSSVTLMNLLPRIAAYRDAFYEQLIKQRTGPHAERLRHEAAAFKQPFAGARQHLNMALARNRALQLQNVNLALIYAQMGYPVAAAKTIRSVAAVSARMTCDIQCRLAEVRRALDRGKLSEASGDLHKVVDLLHDAVECGALIDPWNIIGFSGQFSLFPTLENSIYDNRVDELLDLVEAIFREYARLWTAAAAVDHPELQETAGNDFFEFAVWFDRFAVPMVHQVKRVFGLESHLAAQFAAGALHAWHKAGTSSGDIAFWRPHAEQFDSWQAYAAVLEALFEKDDYSASLGLLVHWAGQADRVHLGENDGSFSVLAMRWLQGVLRADAASSPQPKTTLIRRFLDHLEANAEEFWQIPKLELDDGDEQDLLSYKRGREQLSDDELDDLFSDGDEIDSEDFDAEASDEESEEGEMFDAAYDDVVYRDSTDDGVESPIFGDGDQTTEYELEFESRRIEERLEFLATVAELWKTSAPAFADASSVESAAAIETLAAWREQAVKNRRGLLNLLKQVRETPLIDGTGGDSPVEYDRRRVVKESLLETIISTCVITADAIRWIQGALYTVQSQQTVSKENKGKSKETPPCSSTGSPFTGLSSTASPSVASPSEPDAERAEESSSAEIIALWSALVANRSELIRERWPQAVVALRRLSLLYIPLNRDGVPHKIVATRCLHHAISDLLERLPRLGLLRESCQLLATARSMEQDHPIGPGAVSEFDRLFEVGYKSLVESMVESSSVVQPRPATVDAETPDEVLVAHLQQLTESLVAQWLAHSRTLRLSILEKVSGERDWNAVKKFIEKYGREIFTQQFLGMGNLRAILHQGVEAWLDSLSEEPETSDWKLVADLGDKLPRSEAIQHLSLIMEAIVENYGEYRDYNTTTTHSDRGEMIYTLLDLLRLKMGYERINWNLRPLVMAHDVLVRHGRDEAAELWRRAIVERTSEEAEKHVRRLQQLQIKHSLRIVTLADRIGERFIRPLAIDRLCALVHPAVQEMQQGLTPTAFQALEQEANELAAEPAGVGLDVPDWIIALEEAASDALSTSAELDAGGNGSLAIPWTRLTWDEIQTQLTSWETLTLPGE